MRLKQEIPAFFGLGAAAVLTLCLFASGRQVFASEQPAFAKAPARQAQAPAPVPAAPQTQPSGPELAITAEDAVKLALENNMAIQTERLSPQVAALALEGAQAAYAPTLFSNFSRS